MVVQTLANFVKADDLIASSLQFSDGLATGKFDGEPTFRENKLKKVKEYVKGKNIDLDNCAFYSDSIHDFPLLNEVGFPVCVNTDNRLKNEAIKQNWEIMKCKVK